MSNMDSTFQEDKKRGELGESLVRKTFTALGYEIKDVSQDSIFQEQDVDYITADGIKYEVKTDYKLSSTGNLALESEVYYKSRCELKSSWLWTSKADYFIFVNPHDTSCIYSIAASDLKHLARTEKFERYYKDGGYKETTLILLPLGKYLDCFNSIETNL